MASGRQPHSAVWQPAAPSTPRLPPPPLQESNARRGAEGIRAGWERVLSRLPSAVQQNILRPPRHTLGTRAHPQALEGSYQLPFCSHSGHFSLNQ